MATARVCGVTHCAPHIAALTADRGGLGGAHNDLCAYQVIILGHHGRARRSRAASTAKLLARVAELATRLSD